MTIIRLQSGWSSRANADILTGINETEQAAIAQVLERASKVDEVESDRIK